ncbi:MAG: cysteine desulfurase family protein [Parvibaculaceae bacterium]
MTGDRTYLDWNATAPLRAEARAAMLDVIDRVGNASSVHAEGRRARATVEQARENVAALLGVVPDGITFTSGGTEANHLAFRQAAAMGASAILYSAIEHPSVIEAARLAAAETGLPLHELSVTGEGRLCPDALDDALASAGARPFVSVMAANNETGVLQPVAEIARRVHEAGGVFHSDMVQLAGKESVDLRSSGIDIATVSAHKMGGPQGVGALVLREDMSIAARQTGGGQERGRRSGTENVIGIVGFGAAAAAAGADLAAGEMERVRGLRDALEAMLQTEAPDAVVFGGSQDRLANTSCLSHAGLKAETLLMQLDLAGIAVSAGSACSSGKVARSHVLAAMGVGDGLAAGAVRVSMGLATRETDIEKFAAAWLKTVASVTRVGSRASALAAEG